MFCPHSLSHLNLFFITKSVFPESIFVYLLISPFLFHISSKICVLTVYHLSMCHLFIHFFCFIALHPDFQDTGVAHFQHKIIL